MIENENATKETSGLSSRSMNCSTRRDKETNHFCPKCKKHWRCDYFYQDCDSDFESECYDCFSNDWKRRTTELTWRQTHATQPRKNVAVCRSRSLTCSAYAVKSNAERRTIMSQSNYQKIENLKYTLLEMFNSKYDEYAANGDETLLRELAQLQIIISRVEENLDQSK